ncbi:hypothetical protein [Fundidesulfovibrio magnetotacticus]|uniref:hypothetical protein n=1 Tax=Fundidesulfovibrio magnetotacticus TaxID=2730080 RepID=UPI0015641D02|nr:hypothetical protein [Fundidesulfovibrio magnetotacticus]
MNITISLTDNPLFLVGLCLSLAIISFVVFVVFKLLSGVAYFGMAGIAVKYPMFFKRAVWFVVVSGCFALFVVAAHYHQRILAGVFFFFGLLNAWLYPNK